MAKNLFFYNLKEEFANSITKIDATIFACAEELNTLNKAIKKARIERDDAKTAALASSAEWSADAEEEKALRILESKRSAVGAYQRRTLFGDKETRGLYEMIGVDSNLYNAFCDMQTLGKTGAYRDEIKTLMIGMGMDTSKDMVSTLISRLERAAGNEMQTISGKRNGSRVKVVTYKKFQEVFTGKLIEIISKKTDITLCRSAENFSATFEYDCNLKVENVLVEENETSEN